MYFAENVKTIRQRWKEKQTEFAARFQMSSTNISRIEAGEYMLGLMDAFELSKQTGICMENLITTLLSEDDIPIAPIGEGGEAVVPKPEKIDVSELNALSSAVAALASAMEAERAENAVFRRKMESLERKVSQMDDEFSREMGRKK